MKKALRLLPLALMLLVSIPADAQRFGLVSPAANEVVSDEQLEFRWNYAENGSRYRLWLSSNAVFTDTLLQLVTPTNSYRSSGLPYNSKIYWNVAYDSSGIWVNSTSRLFTHFRVNDPAGLVLWLDANRNVEADGSNLVNRWINLVDSIDYVQTSVNRPYLSDTCWDGKKALIFDGIDDYLNGGDVLDMLLVNRSMFVLGRKNISAGNGCLYSKASVSASAQSRYGLQYSGTSLNSIFHDNAAHTASATRTPGSFEILTQKLDRSGTATNTLYANSGSIGTATSLNPAHSMNSSFNFYLGANNNTTATAPQNYLAGALSELIFYDAVLNDSSRLVVEDYLHDKYIPVVNLGEDRFLSSLSAGNRFKSYLWSTGSTASSITVSPCNSYWVQATDEMGRVSRDTIYIPFNMDIGPANDSFCLGSSYVLNAFAGTGYSYLWQDGSTDSTFSATAPGDYSVLVDNGSGCWARDAISLKVDSFSISDLLPDSVVVCDDALYSPMVGAASSLWSTGDTTASIVFPADGDYWLIGSSGSGCSANDTTHVQIDYSCALRPAQLFSVVQPIHLSVQSADTIRFEWNNYRFLQGNYHLWVSSNSSFSDTLFFGSSSSTFLDVDGLPFNQICFWQVVYDSASILRNSDVYQFTHFRPDGIGGLSLWLDAQEDVTLSGSAVSSWANRIDGLAFQQSSSSARPILVDSMWDGPNALVFDGTDDYLTAGDTLDLRTNSHSIICFGKKDNNIGNGAYYTKSSVATTASRFGLQYSSGNISAIFYDLASRTITTARSASKFEISAQVINRTSREHKLFMNSNLLSTVSALDSSHDMNSTYSFFIGANNNTTASAAQNFLNGSVAELLMYTSVLSDSLRILTESYIHDKYIPKVNLGPDRYLSTLDAGKRFSSYLWSTGATGRSISVNPCTIYWVQVSDALGRVSSDTIFIPMNSPMAGMSSDSFCLGSSLLLNAYSGPSFHYEWQDGSSSSSFMVSIPGEYQVLIYDSLGCWSRNSIQVFADSFALSDLLPPAETVCDSAVYSPSLPAGSYLWSTGDTTAGIIFPADGNYQLQLINGSGCVANDSMDVQIDYSCPLHYAQEFHAVLPAHLSVLSSDTVLFLWDPYRFALDYKLLISSQADLSDTLYFDQNPETSRLVNTLAYNQHYYWRVIYDSSGHWLNSPIYQFSLFRPNDPTGLTLWLDANQQTTADASSFVSNWQSRLDGLSFSQANSAKRPKLVDSMWDGPKAITFDGSDDFLNAGDTLDLRIANRTYFLFARKYNNVGNGTYYSKSIATTVADRISAQYAGVNFNAVFHDAVARTITTARTAGNFELYTQEIDRTAGLMNIRFNYVNTASTTGLLSSYDMNSSYNYYLGAVTNSSGSGQQNYLSGAISELIQYDRVFDDSSKQIIEQYIHDKYIPRVNLGMDRYTSSLDAGNRFKNYIWSTGDTSSSINVSPCTVYWVQVTDEIGRISSDTIYIPFDFSFAVEQDTFCLGDVYSIDADIGGAYQYLWQDGSTSSVYHAVDPGRYSVLIYDSLGCWQRAAIELVQDSFVLTNLLPDDSSICAGNSLSVINPSSSVSYLWSTGTSGETESFVSDGDYSLLATNIEGCIAHDTISIRIQGIAPVVDFAYDTACLGTATVFSDLSSTVSPFSLIQWVWDFGDAVFDSTASPLHVYPLAGSYTVGLKVTNDSGCSNSMSHDVYVYDRPQASFRFDIACAGAPMNFDELCIPYGGDSIQSYQWNFGNGDASLLRDPLYSYPEAGRYNVSLQISSANGCFDVISDSVDVFPALLPDFSWDKLCIGDTVQFSDISPSFSIVNWLWDFGDTLGFSPLQHPNYRYLNPGIYTPTLTVVNAIGCVNSISKSITIYPAPEADFGSTEPCISHVLSLTDSSLANGDSIIEWHWATNNGFTATGNTAAFVFTDSGTYSAGLYIRTANGCSDSISGILNVHGNPIANFSYTPEFGDLPYDAFFNNLSSGNNSYNWDFNDGAFSSSENPAHRYDSAGDYRVLLTATNQYGCSDTSSRLLRVRDTDNDLAIESLSLNSNIAADQTERIEVLIRFRNLGTSTITSAVFQIHEGDRSIIRHQWLGLLNPGDVLDYSLPDAIVLTDPSQRSFVCAEAMEVNVNGIELRYDNNSACSGMTNSIELFGPFPNPAYTDAEFQIISSIQGMAGLRITDALGQDVFPLQMLPVEKGGNAFILPISALENGQYLMQIRMEDKIIYRKLQVLH